MKRLILFVIALAAAAPAFAQPPAAYTPPKNDKIPPRLEDAAEVLKGSPRHGEWVDIKMPSGPALKSWVVYPERADKAGVVLVIHDIYGMAKDVVAWPQAVADQLAKEGFIAIAPDLLSGKGPNGAGAEAIDNVGQVIRTVTTADVVNQLNAAMAYGKALPSSNGKTSVIGFCWGGDKSFAYAIAQPGLAGAVVYYGQAPGSNNPFAVDMTELGKLKVPVIGFYGGADGRVTSTVEPTVAAAKQLGKSYEPHVFEGAGHGFLRNRQIEANYQASEQAWPLTVAFLKDKLK